MIDGHYDVPAETVAVIEALRRAGYAFAVDPADGGLIVLPSDRIPLTDTVRELLEPFDAALRQMFLDARDFGGPLRH